MTRFASRLGWRRDRPGTMPSQCWDGFVLPSVNMVPTGTSVLTPVLLALLSLRDCIACDKPALVDRARSSIESFVEEC